MAINKNYWLLLLLSMAVTRIAYAEPYFAVQMGLKCSACHVNPTGGGMRTTFGSLWGQTTLPANTLKMTEAPFTGEISRYLALGANLRADATVSDTPDTATINSFDLSSFRLYGELRAIPGRLSVYFDERLAPGGATNEEAYVLYRSRDQRIYAKAGQMYLPYGIRLQDNGAYIREQTGISFLTPDRGVEFGFDGAHWTAQLSISNGTAGGPEVDSGKQWSLRSEYVQSHWRAGASFNYNDFDEGSRRMQNLFGGIRTGPVSWLAEADYIVEESQSARRETWATLLEANWLLRKGHNLKLTAEHLDPKGGITRDQQMRLSAVYEYTPLPFVQLRAGLRNYDDQQEVDFLNQRILFLQVNGFF
ncbi:MAG: hypothetical protein ABI616_05695 [Pseudomonadota bacterium]